MLGGATNDRRLEGSPIVLRKPTSRTSNGTARQATGRIVLPRRGSTIVLAGLAAAGLVVSGVAAVDALAGQSAQPTSAVSAATGTDRATTPETAEPSSTPAPTEPSAAEPAELALTAPTNAEVTVVDDAAAATETTAAGQLPSSRVYGPAGATGRAGIPVIPLAAYQRAAARLSGCGIPWWLIAGIGRVESGHAAGGRVDAAGKVRGAIYGPRLDGSLRGTMIITDTDGGRLDADPAFDRAVGPMQFLPSTWSWAGRDGNGDGVLDPQNVYDAALAAGAYLCRFGSLRDQAAMERAVFSYNGSAAYVNDVMTIGRAYGGIAAPTTSTSTTTTQAPPPAPAPGPAPAPAPAPAPPAPPAPAPAPSPSPTPPPNPSPSPTPSPSPDDPPSAPPAPSPRVPTATTTAPKPPATTAASPNTTAAGTAAPSAAG